MNEILQWLKSSMDYEEGARLYLIHGRDHALRRIFSEPVSDFKKKKLHEVLKALVTTKTAVATKVAVTKEKAIEHIAESAKKWPKQKDDITAALHEKWKPLFAEMMSLTNRIYDVAYQGQSDPAIKQEAGRMAHRICDLDDECDAIYKKRDYYQQYGKLPEDKKPMELVVDPLKIPLALSNARRYVSDYKNKLRKKPDDVFAASTLAKYQWAVAEYCKILKIDL